MSISNSANCYDRLKECTFSSWYLDPATHVDSEYSRAGVSDPKIVITTSRDPSSKLLQFAKVHSFTLLADECGADITAGNAPRIPKFASYKSRKLCREGVGRCMSGERCHGSNCFT